MPPPVLPAKKVTAIKETRITPSKIWGVEWLVVIMALFFIDGAEALLDLFAIGGAVNRVIDIIVGGGLIAYLYLRGEFKDPHTKKRALQAFVAVFIVENIPYLDAAPFWFFDGLYYYHLSRLRNKRSKAQKNRVQEMTKKMTAYEQRNRILALQEYRAMREEEELIAEGEQMLEEAEAEAGLR